MGSRQPGLRVDDSAAADGRPAADANSARRARTLAERPRDDPVTEHKQQTGEERNEARAEERVPVPVVETIDMRRRDILVARVAGFTDDSSSSRANSSC